MRLHLIHRPVQVYQPAVRFYILSASKDRFVLVAIVGLFLLLYNSIQFDG